MMEGLMANTENRKYVFAKIAPTRSGIILINSGRVIDPHGEYLVNPTKNGVTTIKKERRNYHVVRSD